MTTRTPVLRNSVATFLGLISGNLAVLAVSFLIARCAGTQSLGAYSLVMAGVYFFIMIAEIWLKPIFIREAARAGKDKQRKIIGSAILLMLGFAGVGMLCLLMARVMLKLEGEVAALVYPALILLPLLSGIVAWEVVFRVSYTMDRYVRATIAGNVLFVVLAGYAVVTGKPLLFVVLALIVVQALVLGALIFLSRRLLVPDFSISKYVYADILRASLPLALTALFIAMYQRLDQILLYKLAGVASVGLYAAALRIAESLNIIPLSLMASVFPLLARSYRTAPQDFEKLYRLSFQLLAVVIFPAAMFITLFSRPLMLLIYGREFASAGPVLIILSWSLVFVFYGVVNKHILIAADLQKIDPFFTGVSAAVGIGLNLILIPRFSYQGAAAAFLAAVATGPILGLGIPQTREYSLSMVRVSIKPLGCALLMAGVIQGLRIPLRPAIAVAPLVYGLLLVAVRGIHGEDVRLLKSLWAVSPASDRE